MFETFGNYTAEQAWAQRLRALGWADALAVLEDPRITVWRNLPERSNGTFDDEHGRLHVKRFHRDASKAVTHEVDGLRLLMQADIPTTPLVAHAVLADSRGFIITADLAGHVQADHMVQDGTPFQTLLGPTARLARKLHDARLHHRDLYLNHFMSDGQQLALVDAGRVARLPRWLARRWIIKDLSQFEFSLRQVSIGLEARRAWLAEYGRPELAAAIDRKADVIARKHVRLLRKRPERNATLHRD